MQPERIERLRTLSAELHEIVKKLDPGAGTSNMDKLLLQKKCMEVYEEIFLLDEATAMEMTNPGLQVPVTEAVILPQGEDPNIVTDIAPPLHEETVEHAPVTEPETKSIAESSDTGEDLTDEAEGTVEAEPVQTGLFEDLRIVEEKHGEEKAVPHDNHDTKPQEEKLHERISRNLHGGKDFSHHMESRVESLKSAISLNKKIAFVNDLFKENTVEYAKAIEKLNTASEKNEALRYFSELKHNYGWDNNNELVKDLENMIIKRYS